MTQTVVHTLLTSLDIAAFERRPDGSFSSLAPAPAWFAGLADVTFPFLGHILDEANQFWRIGTPGSREWGPCAEVDESGREFHYMVRALLSGGREFLVFQLDTATDRLREILQQVRDQKLAVEKTARAHKATAADLRKTHRQIKELLRDLLSTDPSADQLEIANALAGRCVHLMDGVSTILRSSQR